MRSRSLPFLLAWVLLSGVALAPSACFDTCGRTWEGPIPEGRYAFDRTLAWGDVDEAELEAIEATLAIEVQDGQILVLSYIDPTTRSEVILEYTIKR